jgi:hypothetical protein
VVASGSAQANPDVSNAPDNPSASSERFIMHSPNARLRI